MTAFGYLKAKLSKQSDGREFVINANAPVAVSQYTSSWAAVDAIEAALPNKPGVYRYKDAVVTLSDGQNGRKRAKWEYHNGYEYRWDFYNKRGMEWTPGEWNGAYKHLGNIFGVATKPEKLVYYGPDSQGALFKQNGTPWVIAFTVDGLSNPIAQFKSSGTVVSKIDSSGNYLKGNNRMMTLAEFKTVVAASTDFADFKTRVAALT